jgi:hypothetical protein
MRLQEFLYEDAGTGYLVKNNMTYMPLSSWLASETGEDPANPESELDEEQENNPNYEPFVNDPAFKNVSDDDFKQYLTRVKADQVHRRSKDKSDKKQQDYQNIKQQWTDIPAPRNKKERKKDYYTQPFVHGSSIKFMQGSTEIDVNSVKNIIKTRPKNLLKQNEKMEHTAGEGGEIYFNVGLPALKGVAVNEQNDQFIFVDTCPGAGGCQSICYAKKGNYVMYNPNWEKSSKTLNFLINDPGGFVAKLSAEIQKELDKWGKKDYQVSVRWHDAGDFFSDQYLNLAFDIANKFPNVNFYCYTKIAGVMLSSKPKNFITNWSEGAKPEENKKIKEFEKMFGKLKRSIVVPVTMFDKYTSYHTFPDPKNPKKTVKQLSWHSDATLQSFIRDLVLNYGVPKDSVVTYDQLVTIPKGDIPKWNVIVRPGDGDSGANRHDVDGVFLLFH